MTDVPSDETELNAEAIKLLMQVAAANDHVHERERDFLTKLAKAWNVSPVLDALFAELDGAKPLDQPNIDRLRPRADKVLRAAQALIAVDGEVDGDEDEMLAQLKTLLGAS